MCNKAHANGPNITTGNVFIARRNPKWNLTDGEFSDTNQTYMAMVKTLSPIAEMNQPMK